MKIVISGKGYIGREQSNSKIGDEYMAVDDYFWKRVHAYYAE